MEALASGSWLTHDRVRRVAVVAALAWLVALAWLFGMSSGTLDALGRPLGTDFSNVWTAGLMANGGRSAEVWDWPSHFAVQQAIHGKSDVDLFGWHYPPPFLLVASGLAFLRYVPALVVWQLATLIPFAVMMQRLVPGRDILLLTFAAPVTLICLAHGHNGFLTALLLGSGLLLLDRRPLIAGLLFGCLIYKPQFGLIIPVLLVAGGHWRAIAGAFISAGALVALTLAIWGWPVWQAFFDSMALTREIVIEEGRTGWHKIMSPFAAARMWGSPIPAAWAAQLVFTLAAMAAVAWLSRRRDAPELRNALVCAAVVIATPYVLDYDLVVLLPALAWLWIDGRKNGFLPWDASAMALVWFAPLVARAVAQLTLVPLGLVSALLVAAIALRRASVRASPSRRSHAVSGR